MNKGSMQPADENSCPPLQEIVLTGHPVSAVVTHELDGRIDHAHCDVDAGLVLGFDAAMGSFQKVLDAWSSFTDRLTENETKNNNA